MERKEEKEKVKENEGKDIKQREEMDRRIKRM